MTIDVRALFVAALLLVPSAALAKDEKQDDALETLEETP